MSHSKLFVVAGCLLVSGMAALLRGQTTAQTEAYVVGWNEGEILLDARGRTTSVNVSPETGSIALGFTTQDMPVGSGILVHRHDVTEEILFIHGGEGTLILGDDRIDVATGDTIYVPRGTYHGLENPDSAVQMVAIVTPPGLENFFREMFWHPGEEPKQLTPEEISAIEQRYDSVARPD